MNIVLFAVAAYLIGSISFAVVVSKLFGLGDPRTYGSKNPGATNVLRSGNKVAAIVTLIGDGFKGWIAVWLAQKFGPQFGIDDGGIALVAIAVFLGHLWPIFFRFVGGKGVATMFGVLIGINPWLGLGALATWGIIAYAFRYSSLAALVTCLFAPFFYTLLKGPDIILLMIVVMSVLLVYRHAKNIGNLLAGKESRIGAKKSETNSKAPKAH
ncbi:glycerol-3-phosphate 1-O-acyltransferase PlsY [Glaciimonas immobilis]|uniref:Glycerol-3-phosphate acyltransferase n=1 Tax=Glaciimonas immobilis TaxID=728004 RepID=A0A840RVL8_9BURK|nr:glycerol-3-phosphate 1-O-acyltransferase PlsY [Glaciimonas immobilis]KAF3997674.1 glycerol-3-phosphate 1-O-acyltransferase PlsY [Glaciimonas immobilis]MBB5200611.1 glycerol-3-phosphate acyltransferase PlsY [Glaciimonas immobilis]